MIGATASSAVLILNPLAPQDADDLFEVRGDPEGMAFWDWPHDANPAVTARVIEQLLRDVATGEARYGLFAFVRTGLLWGCVI